MVATELITGMGELVNYIRELEEENKKQQERAETFRVRLCNRSEELVKALSPWKKEHQDHKRILEAIGEVKEENKKLKEENKKLKIPDGVVRAFKGLVVNWWEDEEKYYRENFDMKEKYDDLPLSLHLLLSQIGRAHV